MGEPLPGAAGDPPGQVVGMGHSELGQRRDACGLEGLAMVRAHEGDEGEIILAAPLLAASIQPVALPAVGDGNGFRRRSALHSLPESALHAPRVRGDVDQAPPADLLVAGDDVEVFGWHTL